MSRQACGWLTAVALALGATVVAGEGGEPPFPSPRGSNFGGWAVSRGRFTFTGDGRVGTSVGAFTFFDGGLTATRIGSATSWNDGRVSARLGRYEVFNDGVVGVPTRGGMVFTPGFAPAAPRRAATHHAGPAGIGR